VKRLGLGNCGQVTLQVIDTLAICLSSSSSKSIQVINLSLSEENAKSLLSECLAIDHLKKKQEILLNSNRMKN
jgi:hypothetical protein